MDCKKVSVEVRTCRCRKEADEIRWLADNSGSDLSPGIRW